MSFVANFTRFPAVETFWKLFKIWQSYREYKGGNVFETQWTYSSVPYLWFCEPINCSTADFFRNGLWLFEHPNVYPSKL